MIAQEFLICDWQQGNCLHPNMRNPVSAGSYQFGAGLTFNKCSGENLLPGSLGRFIDRELTRPVKYAFVAFDLHVLISRSLAVSLVKIIVITVLIILSILFLGRFFI